MKTIHLFASLALVAGAGLYARSIAQSTGSDKLEEVRALIANTSPEGLDVLRKVLQMRPEVNATPSAKRLGEIVDDFTLNKNDFNITPIGWAASPKRNGRWRIVLYYQDYNKRYQAAEWEYNPKKRKLYPFELTNAPSFWSSRFISAPGRS
jgi:hypothetical protein